MRLEPKFVPSGFFALRTPLLPFDELLHWSAGLAAPVVRGEPTRLDAALAADKQQLRARLQAILTQPAVRDAIFVASPDLHEGYVRWLRGRLLGAESEKGQKIERSLVRYFMRMAGRPTPFGLFAGCSVGTLGEATQLALPPRRAYQRHTRLDMDYLFALADALGQTPAVRNNLLYRPNSSLYRAAGRIRYAEARLTSKQRSYHLVAVEETPYLAATLERARCGASPTALAAALVASDPEIALEEAEIYIDELINSQLLVSALTLTVTGPEPIHDLLAQLHEQPVTAPIAAQLTQTRDALAAIDAAGLGVEAEAYRAIARQLEALPPKVELARLFQVDMIKPTHAATLGQAVLDEIRRGVAVLHRFFNPRQDALTRFREAFTARYEAQEAPLVEVLDEENGIGFDNVNGQAAEAAPLLAGLAFPPALAEPTTPWPARQALLLRKVLDAQQTDATTIEITAADLDKIGGQPTLPLPDAFAVMANIAAPSAAAVAQGDFRVFLHGASGPSGARLLGRFCHADPVLQQYVEQHLQAEEALQPDALFAEIAHLPEGRIGNILCRPVLRSYELPYLGRSSAAPEYQIPLTDLLVRVEGNQVSLRSQRLNRRVIPRLTSAHNYGWRNLGVYKFLCSLQNQGCAAGLGWDWGALESALFLPRVTSGRLVLSRARWLVQAEEIKRLTSTRAAASFQTVQTWRHERRLPRWVVVADGDNELPVDLDNVLSIETFLDLLKNRSQATLVELYPGPDELCVHGPEGRFTHEIIVPFVRQPEAQPTTNDERRTISEPVFRTLHSTLRTFLPGSAWLYAKLYTGTATADQILTQVIAPVTAALQASGAVDQWFFIRYADPDWHLRVRFHGDPTRLLTEALPSLHAASAPLLANGQLRRLQLDTYEREVERYGGPYGIELAERLFHADSEAVLAMVEQLAGDAGAEARWRLALCGIDQLLTDLRFDEATQYQVIKRAREAFAQEFRVDKHLIGQLAEKFRKERKTLETLLDPAQAAMSDLAPGLQLLHQRSAQLAPVVAELQTRAQAGQLTAPLPDLAPSYLHMHVNRLLRASQRAQELVLYDFLVRLYESRLARARQAGNPGVQRKPKATPQIQPLDNLVAEVA
ncbi:MAG: lantibiotic dehydratase [Caldilineaceae bacterium]